MRGSIFGVAGLAIGAAMLPLMLDVDVGSDSTGETALTLLTAFDPLIGLAVVLAAVGLLVAFFTDSGF